MIVDLDALLSKFGHKNRLCEKYYDETEPISIWLTKSEVRFIYELLAEYYDEEIQND